MEVLFPASFGESMVEAGIFSPMYQAATEIAKSFEGKVLRQVKLPGTIRSSRRFHEKHRVTHPGLFGEVVT